MKSLIEVRKSGIHNNGVFARRDIKKGTRVIEYIGERISKSEAETRVTRTIEKAKKNSKNGAVYIFELNKRYDIDGNVPDNTARLINHSCDPNCETEIIDDHIWIIAIKNIKKGTEITYNYGYDLEDFEEHRCSCGSPRCPGYIVAEKHWPNLRQMLKNNKKKK